MCRALRVDAAGRHAVPRRRKVRKMSFHDQSHFRGVGTSKIVGRIHVVQIKMGNQFFAASAIVLEDDKIDFLFGLDLLRSVHSSDSVISFLSGGINAS